MSMCAVNLQVSQGGQEAARWLANARFFSLFFIDGTPREMDKKQARSNI